MSARYRGRPGGRAALAELGVLADADLSCSLTAYGDRLTRAAALPVPQAALARISEYFPPHPRWQTDWGHQGGYSLDELGWFVPPGYRMPRLDKRLRIEGRNTGDRRRGQTCG